MMTAEAFPVVQSVDMEMVSAVVGSCLSVGWVLWVLFKRWSRVDDVEGGATFCSGRVEPGSVDLAEDRVTPEPVNTVQEYRKALNFLVRSGDMAGLNEKMAIDPEFYKTIRDAFTLVTKSDDLIAEDMVRVILEAEAKASLVPAKSILWKKEEDIETMMCKLSP